MSKFKAGDLALNLQDIPNCISAGVVVELMSRLAPVIYLSTTARPFR